MTDLNNEGKPNDRSTFIKQYLERYEYCKGRQIGAPFVVATYPEEVAAIEEAERRAKAWDELRMWVGNSGRVSVKMDELVPPDPVDPLDELERWTEDFAVLNIPSVAFSLLRKKLRELKEKRR